VNRTIKIVGLFLVAALFLVGTPPITFNIENYWYEVVDDHEGPGGGLLIHWDEPYTGGSNIFGCSSGSDDKDVRYIITVDGVDVDTVVETTYTLYTPAKLVQIWALVDSEYMSESPAEIELETVETPSLIVWSLADPLPEHPSGFGFTDEGRALSYLVQESMYAEEIDFYVDSALVLAASSEYQPESLNAKKNWISTEESTYEELEIVSPAVPESYNATAELAEGGVYALRVQRELGHESYEYFFAKAKVVAIDENEVVFKVAYQPEAGLRWVVTE